MLFFIVFNKLKTERNNIYYKKGWIQLIKLEAIGIVQKKATYVYAIICEIVVYNMPH